MTFPIGIEISKQYMKLAAPRFRGKDTGRLNCIVEPITSLSDEQIAPRIARILRDERLKAKSAVICLPRDFITVRNLHLPSRDTREIAQMIDLHIGRIVPYKKEEIIFSHQFLGGDEMGYARVLLAIVQIESLRRQVKILEKAGFFIDDINLSSYGVWRWVIKNCQAEINPKDLYIILDIDSLFTDFIIFSQQGFLFTRSINIGVSGIQDTEQAVLIKLIGELKQSLVIFYNEEINKKPVKIFLGGARTGINLVKALEAEFGIPVKSVSLPYSLETKTGKRDIPADASLSALAGIMLEKDARSLSFVLPEIQIKKYIRDKARDLIVLGSFSIYIFSLLCAIFLGRIYNQQLYLKRLDQRYSLIEKETGDLIKQSKDMEFVKGYLAGRRLPLFIIYQLQKIVPSEITINFTSIDEEQNIILRGQAVELSDVFEFITNLERANHFDNIQTKYTRKKKIKEKEITDFELGFRLRPRTF